MPTARIRRARRPFGAVRGHRPEPGDYVIAECPWGEETAQLVEVLGREDDPHWDNLSVLSLKRWPRSFSPEALHEAAAARAPRGAARGREDLRERVIFTMDPADAADFDDALSWRRLRKDRYEVGIHIADVSHYVRPGTALDREARLRATSVYLPGEVAPMLPERLSSDLCSLRPHEPRLAISVLAEVDGAAEVLGFRVVESCIESRARLSYEDAQEILDRKRSAPAALRNALSGLAGLARALGRKRRRRGGLDLDTAEVAAEVDEDGSTLALVRKTRLGTHRIVEEFMLLANRLIAEEAERREAPFLYRVHEAPGETGLETLDIKLKALGLPRLGEGGGNVQLALQRLLDFSLPPEKKRLVHHLVLRALPRAVYSARADSHFGLALRRYAHFTSPIRRYPDLVNHRRVVAWLHGRRRAATFDADDGGEDLGRLAAHTTGQEQAAQEAERDSLQIKSLRFMEQYLGHELDGTIVGMVPRGVFVALDEPPVEGFCRVSEAIDDVFQLDESGVRLIGRRTRRRFSLGDRVRVAVARIDVPARELDLALVSPRPRRSRKTGMHRMPSMRKRRRGGRT
jgi:ribonuclease R